MPFLDPDLLAFAWSLPDDMKHRNGHTKWILKKAMEPLLPAAIVHRPKVGFGAPLRRWLHHELRHLVQDHLSDEKIRARGLFDVAGVRRLINLDKARKVDGAYTIFALLCIEIWCRLFVDGDWKKHVVPAPVNAVRERSEHAVKQLLSSPRTGAVHVLDVPAPAVHPNGILVQTMASLISAGTERAAVDFGRKSLVGKARSRPDLVRQVLDRARRDGFIEAARLALTRLDQPVPAGLFVRRRGAGRRAGSHRVPSG